MTLMWTCQCSLGGVCFCSRNGDRDGTAYRESGNNWIDLRTIQADGRSAFVVLVVFFLKCMISNDYWDTNAVSTVCGVNQDNRRKASFCAPPSGNHLIAITVLIWTSIWIDWWKLTLNAKDIKIRNEKRTCNEKQRKNWTRKKEKMRTLNATYLHVYIPYKHMLQKATKRNETNRMEHANMQLNNLLIVMRWRKMEGGLAFWLICWYLA